MRSQIPNFITVLNALCGFFAVVMLSYRLFDFAAFSLLVASILDFLDGAVARILNVQSKEGELYDSMADLVSFGLAPALYFILFFEGYQFHLYVLAVLGGLLFTGALIRLVRFTVHSVEKRDYFEGLPTPAMALTVISMSYFIKELEWEGGNVNGMISIAVFCMVLFLWMVGKRKALSLKFKTFSLSENWQRYAFIISGLGFALTLGWWGFPWVVISYALCSMLLKS